MGMGGDGRGMRWGWEGEMGMGGDEMGMGGDEMGMGGDEMGMR